MKKQKQKNEEINKKTRQYQGNKTKFDSLSATSFNECTGLIPALPYDDEEYEAYSEVYDYGPKTEG